MQGAVVSGRRHRNPSNPSMLPIPSNPSMLPIPSSPSMLPNPSNPSMLPIPSCSSPSQWTVRAAGADASAQQEGAGGEVRLRRDCAACGLPRADYGHPWPPPGPEHHPSHQGAGRLFLISNSLSLRAHAASPPSSPLARRRTVRQDCLRAAKNHRSGVFQADGVP